MTRICADHWQGGEKLSRKHLQRRFPGLPLKQREEQKDSTEMWSTNSKQKEM